MKKYYTLILFCLLTYSAIAQITIDYPHWATNGDTAFRVTSEPFIGGIEGSNGINQTWNLSSMSITYSDTVLYLNPSSVPYGNRYPYANQVQVRLRDSAQVFYDVNMSDIVQEGTARDFYGTGDLIPMDYDVPRISMEFPLNYGDTTYNDYIRTFTTTGVIAGLPAFDSVSQVRYIQETMICDGWGTLILPSGSYDALRSHEIENRIDSTWVYPSGGPWMFYDRKTGMIDSYNWYGEYIQNPLAHLRYKKTGAPLRGFYVLNPDTVCPVPEANFSHAFVGTGGQVDFTNESLGSPTSWSWDFGDGTTSASSDPTHTYASSGSYTVCLIASNSCGADTTCDTVNVIVTSTPAPLQEKISLYPNPASDVLTITFSDAKSRSLILSDMLGRSALKINLFSNRNTISTGTLPRGTYQYQINEKGVITDQGKLILQ